VLIGADSPGDLEGVISAASLAELHFGVLVAGDSDEHARRAQVRRHRSHLRSASRSALPSLASTAGSRLRSCNAAASRVATRWISRSPQQPIPPAYRS
jgi:hypothetical protein